MKFKIKKPGLLARVILAIILGIIAGLYLPMWCARISATFNVLFNALLGFTVPLLIVGFVAPAIADIGNKAGKLLLATVVIAYLMTFGSGFLAYITASQTFPLLIEQGAGSVVAEDAAQSALPFFSITIEPLMSVMSALVLAFVIGFGCAMMPQTKTLKACMDDFRRVITLLIKGLVIPLLPIYIFGIFFDMALTGTVAPVLATFIKIIAVIFILHIAVLIIQYTIAWMFSGVNPFKALKIMLPAYFTALGTQSSAATIPVTLERTRAMGVNEDIAGFVIPLCATIHMSGSTLKIVSCAIALMILQGIPFDGLMFAGFIGMLAITIIAAPGVPGGAFMASLGLLSSMLGFSQQDCAMMIALYIAMDSFGTACNITGDGAISLIVAKIAS